MQNVGFLMTRLSYNLDKLDNTVYFIPSLKLPLVFSERDFRVKTGCGKADHGPNPLSPFYLIKVYDPNKSYFPSEYLAEFSIPKKTVAVEGKGFKCC